MIQRIQSIYLLGILIIQAIALNFSFLNIQVLTASISYKATGINKGPLNFESNYTLLILGIVAILVSLFCILSFKFLIIDSLFIFLF